MKEKQLCVLAVDDSVDVLELIKLSLEATTEWRVLLSAFAPEGLMKAHRERPDLILSDIQMSGMGGIEMIIKLRSHPQTNKIPILLLTSSPQAISSKVLEELEINNVIAKPFDWFILADLIVAGLESTLPEMTYKYAE